MSYDPKVTKTAWTIWWVFLAGYLAINAFGVYSSAVDQEKALIGFGIVMPILSNFVWWLISFRLRFRIDRWWAIGIVNAVAVGLIGFGAMLMIASRMPRV